MIWLGWVLWHINHCWLFNAKSSIYIYMICKPKSTKLNSSKYCDVLVICLHSSIINKFYFKQFNLA